MSLNERDPALSVQRSGTEASAKEPGAMERALQHLRVMVLEGTLSPGEQVRQQEMADLLGVSRVPLREALNVMADQGLLTHRPHAGYFVSKRSPDEVRQIRRMLELLEDEVMATIIWPDAKKMAELRALNAQMAAAASAHDWIGLMRLNRDFHFQIFGLSPDHLVLDELRRLWGLAEPLFAQKLAHPVAASQTLVEHDALIAAIRARDRAACLKALKVHRNSSVPTPAPHSASTR